MSLELEGGGARNSTFIFTLIGFLKVNPNIFHPSFYEKFESMLGLKLFLNLKLGIRGFYVLGMVSVNSLCQQLIVG